MNAFCGPFVRRRALWQLYSRWLVWGVAVHGYSGEKRTLIIQGKRKKPPGWSIQPCVPPAGFTVKCNGGQSPPAVRLPLVQKKSCVFRLLPNAEKSRALWLEIFVHAFWQRKVKWLLPLLMPSGREDLLIKKLQVLCVFLLWFVQ